MDCPAMTKGNERKRFGGETPTDAMSILPWLTATAAPASAQAHIYRRSTAVLVPRSLSSQVTQHQAFASWDLAGHVLRIPLSGRYPPLPVPVQRIFIASSTVMVNRDLRSSYE